MATDRELLKKQQQGQFCTNNSASDPLGEINRSHSRQRDIQKLGSENASTNVAETIGFILERKSWLRSVRFATGTNVTTDNTNYLVLTVYKRTSAGATQKTLASWNTHGAAQGAITKLVSNNMSLSATVSDMIISAGSVITYDLVKAASGQQLVNDTVISLDLEEV